MSAVVLPAAHTVRRPQRLGSGLLNQGVASLLIALGGSGVVSFILLATNGNIPAGATFLAVVILLLVTFYRVDWSFYIFTSLVLVFDQFEIPGFQPLTYTFDYFRNLKENANLPSFSIAVVNPIELHLVLLIVVWFIALGVRKETKVQRVPIWGAAALFFLWLLVSLIYGLKNGGDFLPSLWEVRAFFYLAVLYCLVPQIIQTKAQVRTFLWVCIVAISFKAFQAIYRFIELGGSFQGLPTLTNHEDPVFTTTLLFFLLALWLFQARDRQYTVLCFLFLPLLLGFFMGQRRAAYAALFASLGVFIFLIEGKDRMLLLKMALPFVGAVVIYTAALWNSDSKWAMPVRLVRSGMSVDKETSGERYYSNLYREFEKYNLAQTIKTAPLFGIGFGRKYHMPIPLADIAFPLRDYIPHNEILWVLVKTGAVGFFVFWFFFDAFGHAAAGTFAQLRDPYLKAVSAVIIIAVVNQMVVSYYDLQLTYYRNMIYLGSLMGLLPTLREATRPTSEKINEG